MSTQVVHSYANAFYEMASETGKARGSEIAGRAVRHARFSRSASYLNLGS